MRRPVLTAVCAAMCAMGLTAPVAFAERRTFDDPPDQPEAAEHMAIEAVTVANGAKRLGVKIRMSKIRRGGLLRLDALLGGHRRVGLTAVADPYEKRRLEGVSLFRGRRVERLTCRGIRRDWTIHGRSRGFLLLVPQRCLGPEAGPVAVRVLTEWGADDDYLFDDFRHSSWVERGDTGALPRDVDGDLGRDDIAVDLLGRRAYGVTVQTGQRQHSVVARTPAPISSAPFVASGLDLNRNGLADLMAGSRGRDDVRRYQLLTLTRGELRQVTATTGRPWTLRHAVSRSSISSFKCSGGSVITYRGERNRKGWRVSPIRWRFDRAVRGKPIRQRTFARATLSHGGWSTGTCGVARD